MRGDEPERLRSIKSLPQLVKYLRDDLGWPIDSDKIDDLVFDYELEELGIDPKLNVKIKEIKQIRPLRSDQPWGIFFINFEQKRLPVVLLRRILRALVVKSRSPKNPNQQRWILNDLIFISCYGEQTERAITFAHFAQGEEDGELPSLRVLGWDDQDTILHLDEVHGTLREKLRWPQNASDFGDWREGWSSAFTLAHREVITTSKALATKLAELAVRIRKRTNFILKIERERGPFRKLYSAFKEALIHDLDEDDFADMYAQTVAYGLLTARVSSRGGAFSKKITSFVPVTNPFLRELLETFMTVGAHNEGIDFDEIGVNDVVDVLKNANMEAVLRDFGNRNPGEDPVIQFYEQFLKEYDARKRMQRGVFFTPIPVVSFIVRSVHELLQKEFGLEDGLADTTTWGEMVKRNASVKIPEGLSPDEPFVQILDFATGTGTFLVEVIEIIHKTMKAKWKSQRKTDFEAEQLWNDYIPKHLLPRLYGFELMMAPYAIAHMKIGLKLHETGYNFTSNERLRVYLTNTLEPPQDFSDRLAFDAPALAHEAHAVNAVKRRKRFTVVIGNPPYSNYGKLNRNPFILELLEDYKSGLDERKINLDDDFIKFIRVAQWHVDSTGCGLLGFITNHTYLEGVTHRRMRKALLESFPGCMIFDLHGSMKKKEMPAAGMANGNVFDITVGVAISLLMRRPTITNVSVIHEDLWGTCDEKCATLATRTCLTIGAVAIHPQKPYFFFVPKLLDEDVDYQEGVPLTELFPLWKSGIQTDRDDLFLDFDNENLERRIRKLLKGDFDDEFRDRYRVYASSSFDIGRRLAKSQFNVKNIRPCLYRPFDKRWLYYDPDLTSRPAFEVMSHLLEANLAILCSRQQGVTGFRHLFCTSGLTERCIVSLNSRECTYVFPLYLKGKTAQPELQTGHGTGGRVNLSANVMAGFEHSLGASISAEGVFKYAYAVLSSPEYRTRYAEFLKVDFPRLPLTSSLELFRELARLGGELVALHLMESPKLDKHITKFVGDSNQEIEKVSYCDKAVWIDKAQSTGFVGVPEPVWNFYIGGYQVCEKWLKDRKGRKLSKEDIAHYHRVVVALAETIRLMSEIDKVIDAHGGWPIK